jgi:hypothetical protein
VVLALGIGGSPTTRPEFDSSWASRVGIEHRLLDAEPNRVA